MTKPKNCARPKHITIGRFASATTILAALIIALLAAGPVTAEEALSYDIELTTAHEGFDGETCWVHARAGVIPPGKTGNSGDIPLAVMTTQKLLLSGSDVFYALHELRSDDMSARWTKPDEITNFSRRTFEGEDDPSEWPIGAARAPELLEPGDETTVCDFTPQWHAATGKLLGTGHTVWYRDNRVLPASPRATAYAVYDAKQKKWADWKVLDMPDTPEFINSGAGSVQRVDLENGDILLPTYYKNDVHTVRFSVTVLRCSFDGENLKYIEHGNELALDVVRGFAEPSIAKYHGKFYLTLRNDEHGYVTVSDDGLHYAEPKKWTFDDGSDLGNYNTQQHWVSHSDGLYLVYNRRGADNDHVFRHRAPLFIARVDPEKLHVIRDTERILVPERGARLGNFGITEVNPNQTWVTVTEWMQPIGVEKYGSDNTIWVAKIKWNQPNQQVRQ